ncbi:MAG: imelysin family protein [Cytophagaceae bacterium]
MFHKFILPILCLAWFASCKPGKGIEETPEADRGPMIENYATNIIVPAFVELQSSMSALNDAAVVFNGDRSSVNLLTLRQAFQQSYKDWQAVALYDFGPSTTYGLLPEGIGVNSYPTNTTSLEANITAGGYNFNTANGAVISGFPALDNLLYSRTLTDNEIITLFDDDKRRTYLVDVIQHIKTKVDNVVSDWNTSYSATFKSNLGVDVGSSTSNVVNRLIRSVEIIKNFKVGVPANIIANVLGDPATTYPEKSEAYYSDSSLAQIRASFNAIKRTYTGTSALGVNGAGLDDYLVAIGQASLDATIRNQFTVIDAKLESIPETFSSSLNDNSHLTKIRELHAEFVTLVALLKVDLTSATGVMISYTDNDGD